MSLMYGLVGRAGSGKDTVAAHLVDHYGFVKLAFADKVKQVCSLVYDIPLEVFYNREERLKPHPHLSGQWLLQGRDPVTLGSFLDGVFLDLFGSLEHASHGRRIFIELLPENCTPRQALQLIGTEGFRACCDTVWIDYVMREAAKLLDTGHNIVVSDVRFSNELVGVIRNGGAGIGISRRNLVESYNHASENEVDEVMDGCEAVLSNNASIAELHAKVDRLLLARCSASDLMLKSLRNEVAAWQSRFPHHEYREEYSCIAPKRDFEVPV